jgi:hypothetical protein
VKPDQPAEIGDVQHLVLEKRELDQVDVRDRADDAVDLPAVRCGGRAIAGEHEIAEAGAAAEGAAAAFGANPIGSDDRHRRLWYVEARIIRRSDHRCENRQNHRSYTP